MRLVGVAAIVSSEPGVTKQKGLAGRRTICARQPAVVKMQELWRLPQADVAGAAGHYAAGQPANNALKCW